MLPHSQIHFHDAPLPTQADLNFAGNDWTLAGRDSFSTRSITLTGVGTLSPRPLWYQPFGVPLLASPVVSSGRLYLLATDGYLHVLDARTGKEQWRIELGGELAATGLALAHGMVYVVRDGHFITALDARDGNERWRFDIVGIVRAAPLVVGRILLVASGPDSLWCLDALTGEKYWVFHSEDALMEFWPTRTPPVVAGRLVYVALGAANEFNALDLRTGRKVWEAALGERMTGGPLLDEALGLVYVVTWSGRIVAFSARTGQPRWSLRIPGGSESSPALSVSSNQRHVLYLGGFAGSFYAFDAATGQLIWRVNLGSVIATSPLVLAGAARAWVVISPQAGTCFILGAQDGKQVESWQVGELRASPVVAQGTLYLASLGDQGLFAFTL